MSEAIQLSDFEKKLAIWKLVSSSIGTILIPVTIFWAGSGYYSAQQQLIELELINTAVEILRLPPEDLATSKRSWAIEAIGSFSDSPELLELHPLPCTPPADNPK